MKPLTIFLILVALLSITGCATKGQVFEVKHFESKVGLVGAEAAVSRMYEYRDRIQSLQMNCDELEKTRQAMLADARTYRRLASKASFNKLLTPAEREAGNAHYCYMARKSEDAAANSNELIGMFKGRISTLSSRINQQKTEADKMKRIRMADGG